MKTEFEADLSEAFAARAARVPVAAASRLRAMDFQPRERRLHAPVAVGAGVLAGAATAGAVLSVVLGGAAPAYAGWSAAPVVDTTAPSASADANCLSQLTSTTTSTPAAPGDTSTGQVAWQSVLTDVRGPFTVALFQSDGAYAACFTSSSFTEVDQISSSGGSGASSGRLSVRAQGGFGSGTGSSGAPSGGISTTSSGSLSQVLQNHLTTVDNGPYTLVDGRTQPGVTAVTLVDGGQNVVATVADGWFVAWWPGSSSATSAQVTTSSGTTIEPLVQRPMPTPPAVPSYGSGSQSSGNSGSGTDSGGSGTGPSTSFNP